MDAVVTRMTVQEFDQWVELPDNTDQLFEFIAGEIVEVPSNPYASAISATIAGYLHLFLRERTVVGHLTGQAGGYMVSGERYAPDVAYISKARQSELAKSGYNPNPPELAVEVDFPSTLVSKRAMTVKVANYLAAGTTVLIVYPETKQVRVFAQGKPVQVLGVNDVFNGGDILPGFVLPIKDIFPPEPTPTETKVAP